MRCFAALACTGLALICACAPSPEPASSPPQPEVTISPITVAPTTNDGEEVAELRATGEDLPAGLYTRSEFDPAIRLELDGSWQAVQIAPGFFDLQTDVGSPDVISVQFANVSGVVGTEDVVLPEGSEDAVDVIRQNPALSVVESSASRIGGREGFQVTVENQSEEHARVLELPPGILGIDPGRRLWIAFFDTEAGILAVMVGGSVAQWDRALAEAEPILESVVIGS